MPFPVIRDGSVFNGASVNSSTFTISVPLHEENDRLLLVVGQDGGPATFTLANWTNIFGDVAVGASATAAVFYKIASDSEPATYDLTSNVSERGAWGIMAVANDGGINDSGQSWAASTVTTTTPGCLLIYLYVAEDNTLPITGGRGRRIGQFSTASGATVFVIVETKEAPGVNNTNNITPSEARPDEFFLLAIEPDNTTPSRPSTTPTASPLQRIRTYP